MDDTTNATNGSTEDVEQVYETWRRGASIPRIETWSMNEQAFETTLKSTFVAGWVQRGRIPASTGNRR